MKRKAVKEVSYQTSRIQKLREAGGRRISVDLPPDIAQAVDRAMRRDGVSQTELVLRMLRRC